MSGKLPLCQITIRAPTISMTENSDTSDHRTVRERKRETKVKPSVVNSRRVRLGRRLVPATRVKRPNTRKTNVPLPTTESRIMKTPTAAPKAEPAQTTPRTRRLGCRVIGSLTSPRMKSSPGDVRDLDDALRGRRRRSALFPVPHRRGVADGENVRRSVLRGAPEIAAAFTGVVCAAEHCEIALGERRARQGAVIGPPAAV